MKRSLCALSAVAALVLAGALQAADFSYGLTASQTTFEGTSGAEVTFTADATLTTTNAGDFGAQGWSLSVAADGCEITGIVIKGLIVDTVYDDDADPGTPNVSAPLDLWAAGFKVAQKATGDYDGTAIPGKAGVVSAVVISQTEFRVLPPTGAQVVAQIAVKGVIPEGEDCDSAKIYYLNGLKGAGQPVNNVVTFEGASVTPTLGEFAFQLCPIAPSFNLAIVNEGGTPAASGDTTFTKNFTIPEVDTSAVVDVPVEVILSSELLTSVDGAQGWSVSIANDACLTVDTVTVKGVIVDTVYDDDADPGTPNVIAPLDLFSAGFKVAQKATGDYDGTTIAGTSGVVSAVVISQTEFRVLRPNVADRVLKINYKATVTKGERTTCRISLLDGLKGAGQPVNNVITYQGASKKAKKQQGLVVDLGVAEKPPMNSAVAGDSNDDDKVNIADAVNIIYNVVPGLQGDPSRFVPITCDAAGDANSDGAMNLADAIFVIDFQFRGGPAPAAGCVEVAPDLCAVSSSACPTP